VNPESSLVSLVSSASSPPASKRRSTGRTPWPERIGTRWGGMATGLCVHGLGHEEKRESVGRLRKRVGLRKRKMFSVFLKNTNGLILV
jgi:hypothetical protein